MGQKNCQKSHQKSQNLPRQCNVEKAELGEAQSLVNYMFSNNIMYKTIITFYSRMPPLANPWHPMNDFRSSASSNRGG